MRTVLAFIAVFAVGAAAAVRADAPRSLGEVAAQEKDKKKPTKVYTEDDLRRGGRGTLSQPGSEGAPSESSASPAPDASPAAGEKKAEGAAAEKPKTEEEERAEREKAWREKLTQAQADVATWTAEVARLQTALNDLTGPLYGSGRAARAEALENAKRQLAAANQSVETLQEEGRRNRFR